MKLAWQIARVAGISIRIHATFPLLLGWAAAMDYQAHHSWSSVFVTLAFVLVVFLVVVLHELGHALTARRFGIRTHDITLLPIGGVASLERIPSQPRQELLVALAGPAVNVVLAALLFAWLGWQSSVEEIFDPAWIERHFLARMAWVNVGLAVFNLLPAFPMDGGRVLRAGLAMRLPYVRATQIAVTVGHVFAALLGFAGLVGNPFLAVIAVFIWVGASVEGKSVRVQSVLAGVAVKHVMLKHFQRLHPADPLSKAAEFAVSTGQHHFPVIERGRLIGLLFHRDLLANLATGGATRPVSEVMRQGARPVRPSDPLSDNILRSIEPGDRVQPVIDGHELVGLLTSESLGEYVLLHGKSAT